jgi:hypothetical protein
MEIVSAINSKAVQSRQRFFVSTLARVQSRKAISIGSDLTQDCAIDNPLDNLNWSAFAVIFANTSRS